MNPSNPAKFGMAFALGLVVALAAVTVYVKTTGLHAQQLPVIASAAPVSTKQPETLNVPKADDSVSSPSQSTPTPVATPARGENSSTAPPLSCQDGS